MSEGDGEVARLRAEMRQMASEMNSLKRDYKGLKERMEADKLCITEHLFTFDVEVATIETTPFVSEAVELNGVRVLLHAAVQPDSQGVQQLVMWQQLTGDSFWDASLVTKCTLTGYNNAQHVSGPFTHVTSIKEGRSILACRHVTGIWTTLKANRAALPVKMSVKLTRSSHPRSLSFEAGEEGYVTVAVGEETIRVHAAFVSEWSSFLRAYFNSQMRESETGVYPIEDCTMDDLREMLDVIYPTSKPIDIWNVHKMLELADRFIMPMLTHRCECFLNDGVSHNLNEIQMLTMADKYNLFLTRTNVLEKLTTTALLRSKIIKTEGYGALSYEMKRAVDARYVELDVQERG